jgi:hypothetical protein
LILQAVGVFETPYAGGIVVCQVEVCSATI